MKIEIKNRFTGIVIFEGEFKSLKECVTAAVKARAYLAGAYLAGADLAGVNLAGADLTGANLTGADLTGAILSGANLTGVRWLSWSPVPAGWQINGAGRLERPVPGES